MPKPTLAIDFDGTIADDSNFPIIGEPKKGVKEAIDKLSEKYEIVIDSCRTSRVFKKSPVYQKRIDEMIGWLNENKIKYDRINMGDEGKVLAEAYIDNRAIRFEDNWDKILKQCINL